MAKKSPMRVVIEELLNYNDLVDVVKVTTKFFGYDRKKVQKMLYEIKHR